MTETDEHGNVFDNPPLSLDTTFMNTPDRAHAKAELALRFLEFCRDTDVVYIHNKDTRIDIKEIRDNCWVIITDYFKP